MLLESLRSIFRRTNTPKTQARMVFVCATRLAEDEFWTRAATGITLRAMAERNQRVTWNISYTNSRGLPQVYNEAIRSAGTDDILIFVHDDVWITDFEGFFSGVDQSIKLFDVVGVAGATSAAEWQPSWCFQEITSRGEFALDHMALSGKIGCGTAQHALVTNYGPTPAACMLLDGVMLISKSSTLHSHQLQFDQQFDFHLYDIDFCVQVRRAGLKLGTWPLGIVHESPGGYHTPAWRDAAEKFSKKINHLLPAATPASAAYRSAIQNGNREVEKEQWDLAKNFYQRAIELAPQQHEGYLCLGYAQQQLGNENEAARLWTRALRLAPGNADAHFMLGLLSEKRGEYPLTSFHMQRALDTLTGKQAGHIFVKLALSYFRRAMWSEALQVLEEAVLDFPERADFHFYRGMILSEAGHYGAASECFETSLQLEPGKIETLGALATCLAHLGHLPRALEILQMALACEPQNASLFSKYLFTLQYSGTLSAEKLFLEHLEYARRFERAEVARRARIDPCTSSSNPIKLGYVSGDLRQHSIAFFLEPILRHHDRSRFSIYCYYNYSVSDHVTQRLKGYSTVWRDCVDLDDGQLEHQIKMDGIDILIDLSGHTGHNRLPVFARRPAPVQMTWLGYQASTGLSSIDFRITDAALDSPGRTEHLHSEKLLRLSMCGVFQPEPEAPAVGDSPCLRGVTTFACLNNPSKITPAFLATAASILARLPDSRMVFGHDLTRLKPEILRPFTERGISGERISSFPNMTLHEYLSCHQQIDIALDTFPYNGGTTTMHSLWMGVPVLCLEGQTAIGRVGSEIMRGLGWPQFACASLDEYADSAVRLANDKKFISSVRAELRQRFSKTLVLQAKALTEELEENLVRARLSMLGQQQPAAMAQVKQNK